MYSYKNTVSVVRSFDPVERHKIYWTPILLPLLIFGAWTLLAPVHSAMATEFFSPSPSIQYLEAKELLAKKKWIDAALLLRNVLKAEPSFTEASINLARALTHAGRREEGLIALTEGLQHDKNQKRGVIIRQQIRVLARMFLTKETLQVFQDGLHFLIEKKYRLARDRFTQALQAEPDNIEILIRLGQCLIMEEDVDSAAEQLRLAKKLSPFEPEVSLWLGRALFLRGEVDESIRTLRYAIAELKGLEIATVWLAEALVATGQRNRAIELLDSDVKEYPIHVMALLSLAQIRYQLHGRDISELWTVRKELQVATSRSSEYAAKPSSRIDSELGLNLRDPAQVQSEVKILLTKVEAKLKERSDE